MNHSSKHGGVPPKRTFCGVSYETDVVDFYVGNTVMVSVDSYKTIKLHANPKLVITLLITGKSAIYLNGNLIVSPVGVYGNLYSGPILDRITVICEQTESVNGGIAVGRISSAVFIGVSNVFSNANSTCFVIVTNCGIGNDVKKLTLVDTKALIPRSVNDVDLHNDEVTWEDSETPLRVRSDTPIKLPKRTVILKTIGWEEYPKTLHNLELTSVKGTITVPSWITQLTVRLVEDTKIIAPSVMNLTIEYESDKVNLTYIGAKTTTVSVKGNRRNELPFIKWVAESITDSSYCVDSWKELNAPGNVIYAEVHKINLDFINPSTKYTFKLQKALFAQSNLPSIHYHVIK